MRIIKNRTREYINKPFPNIKQPFYLWFNPIAEKEEERKLKPKQRENGEEITLRKLGDGRGTNELHNDEVRVGDRRLQLRLESYKGWARVGRQVSGCNRDLGRFKKFVFSI